MNSNMCFEHSMQKNNTVEIEKNQICPDPPPCVVNLDMVGEHLDIIRINDKNPKNPRFYSLRVIIWAIL